jgi:hypothetical protein
MLATGLFLLPEAGTAQVMDNDGTDGAVHPSLGIGFHNVEAPLGMRWWLGNNQTVGLDAGLGFLSSPANGYDERLSDWAIDVGVPILLKSWERFHLIFRPGVMYQSEEVQVTSPPDPFGTDDQTTLTIAAEIEAEIFLVKNVSVSASQGIGLRRVDPAGGGDSQTDFGTFGYNFTNIGFHIYCFGGSN